MNVKSRDTSTGGAAVQYHGTMEHTIRTPDSPPAEAKQAH